MLPLSSWFMAAKPNSIITRHWNALVHSYWSVERMPLHVPGQSICVPPDPLSLMEPFNPEKCTPYPYFWLHHLFGALLQTDPEFLEAWGQRFRLPSAEAHRFANHFHYQTKRRSGLRMVAFQLQRFLGVQRHHPIKKLCKGWRMQKLDWRTKYPAKTFEGFDSSPSSE